MGSFGFGQGFFGSYDVGGEPPIENPAEQLGGSIIVLAEDRTIEVSESDTTILVLAAV